MYGDRLQIIKSWFSLIDDDGWIAREQILGPEARSKVPDEFQVQYPHYANPPTLFLTITSFVDKLTSTSTISTPSDEEYAPQLLNRDAALTYLKDLYPLLKRHYTWFRRSQKGDITSYDRTATSPREAYRWRGRTERHCLTSGQDDFPRAQPPHPGELHVDALAWVGVMASSLSKIAEFLGEEEDGIVYAKQLAGIKANVIDLHWSKEEGMFCDATIDSFEEHQLVCHKGYVTLLPFILGLVDDAEKIASILKVIADPAELWSPHGIRSLSQRDALYATDENYWRSPVWIPINYLILTRLYTTATSPSSSPNNAKEAGRLYKELRKNLVNTVYESWAETGFAWEQYDPETGQGQRTQHFTGWTSLVVKVLGMPEIAKRDGRVKDEL
jgi:mannosyl-oligosaccharide glucosidase